MCQNRVHHPLTWQDGATGLPAKWPGRGSIPCSRATLVGVVLGGPGVEVTLYLLDATVLDCIYCNTFFKGTTVNRAPNLMLLGFSRH